MDGYFIIILYSRSMLPDKISNNCISYMKGKYLELG